MITASYPCADAGVKRWFASWQAASFITSFSSQTDRWAKVHSMLRWEKLSSAAKCALMFIICGLPGTIVFWSSYFGMIMCGADIGISCLLTHQLSNLVNRTSRRKGLGRNGKTTWQMDLHFIAGSLVITALSSIAFMVKITENATREDYALAWAISEVVILACQAVLLKNTTVPTEKSEEESQEPALSDQDVIPIDQARSKRLPPTAAKKSEWRERKSLQV